MRKLSLVLLLFSAASACAQQAPLHQETTNFVERSVPVGNGATAVAAADLDGDGHLDLVVANENDGDLAILRGDGAGNMTALRRVPAGPNPTELALADLNSDGFVDVAVANHDSDHLTLLLGDGTGAFRPAPTSPLPIDVSPHPHAVRAVDLDADGRLDLVVDHRDGEGLLVLQGTGGGAFASPGRLIKSGGDPYLGLAVGDVNADGRLDLVTPNPGAVGVLLGKKGGPLAFDLTELPTEAAPFGVELADLNGDGHLDVVAVSGEESALIELFLGDGQGGFQEAAQSPIRFANGAKKVVRGDFDGDGTDDVAVANYMASDVLLLLGGAGPLRTMRLAGGANPWGLAAADLNEDGTDDLVILDFTGALARLYLSRAQ